MKNGQTSIAKSEKTDGALLLSLGIICFVSGATGMLRLLLI